MRSPVPQRTPRPGPIPATAGIGLRAPHHQPLLAERPAVGWVEVHSENFFAAGGPQLRLLELVRELYPLSLHGVGLSLGSTDSLDRGHLAALGRLVERFEPALVSEHLCWGSVGGRHLNDLLPLPYTEEALSHMIRRVEEVQQFLGRRILIENVSSYLEFSCSTLWEWEFLAELSRASGCGLLLDLNNVYVSSRNHGFDPHDYLAALPADAIHEIHLAGYSLNRADGREILIDTHGAAVADPVWDLYSSSSARLGDVPTLIEWDTDIPALHVLVTEARKADACRCAAHALVA